MKQLVLIIAAIFFYSFTADAQSAKVKNLTNNYLSVAFNSVDGKRFPLTKWENRDTIYYFIEGDLHYINAKRWNIFLEEIEKITNLHFCKSTDINSTNILIYFGNLSDFFEVSNADLPYTIKNDFSTWSSKRWNNSYQLSWTGFCMVPELIKNNQIGAYYLKRLFLKSIGLLGESEDPYSIYSRYYNRNSTFNRNDKRLLKLHYNSIIEAGMTYTEVKETITKLVDLKSLIKEKL
ncbi:MAG: hypothetical protein KQH79_16720 [Bacteroidetes bacterium]|nr:hypothetical protein [Bacteroidota bacterium]